MGDGGVYVVALRQFAERGAGPIIETLLLLRREFKNVLQFLTLEFLAKDTDTVGALLRLRRTSSAFFRAAGAWTR